MVFEKVLFGRTTRFFRTTDAFHAQRREGYINLHTRGHKPFAQSRLTKRLKERGFNRDGGKRHYLGLEMTSSGGAAERRFM